MTLRRSCEAKIRPLILSVAVMGLAGGDLAQALAVPRNPCVAGRHARLVQPAAGETISRFGLRFDPITGKTVWHAGTDYLVEPGVALKAAGLGRVSKVGGDAPGDLFIVVDHGRGIEIRYAHLGRTDRVVGRCVGQGDIIGEAGRQNPAREGQILHIEVRKNGVLVDPSGVLLPY